MPSERITCMWEDNIAIDVREIGAFVDKTMKPKVLWKAGYFNFYAAFLINFTKVFSP